MIMQVIEVVEMRNYHTLSIVFYFLSRCTPILRSRI